MAVSCKYGKPNIESLKAVSCKNKGMPLQVLCRNLAVLIAVGFILRIVAWEIFGGGLNSEYQNDEIGYVNLAIHVAEGLGFTDHLGHPTSRRVPGLPLLVAIPVSLMGSNVIAIRIFMCLIGSLLVPACYLLAHSVTDSHKIGLIAAAIAAVFPTWVIPSGSVLTDVPAAVLVTLMAWALIEGYRRHSLLWIIVAGIVWGTATLVRPVALVYAPAILLWLLIVMPSWKSRVLATMAVLVSFVFILAPWTIRNMQVHGTFVLISSQEGSELYVSNNPEATGILAIDYAHFQEVLAQRYTTEQYPDEKTRSKILQADAIEFIRQNPLRFAELCFVRLIQLWKVYSPRVPLSNSLVVIATFGLAVPFFLIQAIRRGWQRGPEMLLVLIIICHTAVHVVYTAAVRYRIPIEPLVIVLAIQGFLWSFGLRLRDYSEDQMPTVLQF
jgi:4-amino-4-deoxy-L-arabinose transferase-like glycosyltransferase